MTCDVLGPSYSDHSLLLIVHLLLLILSVPAKWLPWLCSDSGTFFLLSRISYTALSPFTWVILTHLKASKSLSLGVFPNFKDWAFCSFCFPRPCCIYPNCSSYYTVFAHQYHPQDSKLHEELNEWIISALLWTSVMTFGKSSFFLGANFSSVKWNNSIEWLQRVLSALNSSDFQN